MADTERFKKGATIIHEGTTGSNAYLILSGSVEVYKKVGDEKLVLSRLVKGNIFGEMSLVNENFGSLMPSLSLTLNVEPPTWNRSVYKYIH